MKSLAITISGAVSLGAYEAGVMYEMLRALAAHNSDPRNEPIVIDVLTGASAGGMTAVILAQKLLFQSERLRDADDNDLYLPWVADVDVSTLLELGPSESADLSILSSDLIEGIARQYLISPYATLGGDGPSPQKRHPAAAERIKLGLAMSNLNGIDYGLKLLSGGQMPYTRFQDELRTDVDSAEPAHNTPGFWEPLRNAAVACGAFPLAFRIKDLLRHAWEYSSPPPLAPLPADIHFPYTDGGVFQNEPIGLAKRLVNDIDQHVNDQRYYLFVAPGMRQSAAGHGSAAPGHGSAAPGSNYFNYWNTGKALVNAIFNQARYRDLEDVERINARVAEFDRQSLELKEQFRAGALGAATMGPATSTLLAKVNPNRAVDVTRLKAQFRSDYDELAAAVGPANADTWLDMVLLLETAASLGPKDTMTVFAITEDDDKLAGGSLFAFGGFFDERYRQHDYDRGRKSARDFIRWLKNTPDTGLGPIEYPLDTLPPIEIDEELDDVQVGDLSRDKREEFRDRLHDRIYDMLEEMGISWLIRQGIDVGFLNRYLNRMFGL